MKSRFLIIIGIVIIFVICMILFVQYFIFGTTLYPTEHCPGLKEKIALGLIDPRTGCM